MPEAGITREKAVEFQRLVREECGVDLPLDEAWRRARRLVALYRMLMAPIPEDSGRPALKPSSNLDQLARFQEACPK